MAAPPRVSAGRSPGGSSREGARGRGGKRPGTERGGAGARDPAENRPSSPAEKFLYEKTYADRADC